MRSASLTSLWLEKNSLATKNHGGGGDSAGPRTPTTPAPPPPLGASGQQLVAKGVTLRRPWAPKAPNAP